MVIILLIRNIFITILGIITIIEKIEIKLGKEIFLFICIYLFLNLYLSPTYALCEFDPNLLDIEKNTYNGSKIIFPTECELWDGYYTEADRHLVVKTCDMLLIVILASIVLIVTYELTH